MVNVTVNTVHRSTGDQTPGYRVKHAVTELQNYGRHKALAFNLSSSTVHAAAGLLETKLLVLG